MLNTKNRSFINEDYLNFIRQLPCCIEGSMGVSAHHTDVKGMGGITNDYYAIPLSPLHHIGNGGHITQPKLTDLIKENIAELVIFYLSLYIEYQAGRYDLEADKECNFYELRKKLKNF